MIYDLLYFGEDRKSCREAKGAIEPGIPDVQFEIDWDDIHGYRLVVFSTSTSRFKYLQVLYKTGFLLESLNFGTMRLRTPKRMLAFCRGMKDK